ncbi:IS110 family RNA-guided transposase [Actinomadura formosensis]|uniref:IS110 family transposase n=1 Tax=Actinomadura formosensis TaxID=60706 RepID=UPI000A4B9270|nr:IS110 family transposase [Actinomadura formosensis]
MTTIERETDLKANEVWIGVDTHRDINVAVALDERGRRLGDATVPTTSKGNAELLAWARSLGKEMRGFAIEGTGGYGASLTRHLQGAGQFVIEATRPRRDRMAHRNDGKSDTLDALRAAKALLAEELAVAPKQRDGDVEALRTLQVVRRSAVKARTSAINAMRAVLVTAPDRLRDQFRGVTKDVLIERCSRLRPGDDGLDSSIKRALRQLARRCKSLTEEIVEVDEEIDRLVRRRAPQLLKLNGVGIGVAATLLVAAGDNPHRLRSEAGFAHMAGAAPLPTGSGLTSGRHRLNRGGNRQANNALWTITLVRLRTDERTKAYAQRRTAEGKTKKEIIRCLKRYIAREIYQVVIQAMSPIDGVADT